jgi:hypothetical protein
MQNLINLNSVDVRQDSEGRFCLKDLHKASGGAKKHQPSNWLQLETTQGLIEEIKKGTPGYPGNKEPVKTINGGTARGTYVVKELVYSYAMWIDPRFHLKVVRTFDAVVSQPQLSPAEALHQATALLVDIERRQQLLEQQQEETYSLANQALETAEIAEAKAQATELSVRNFSIMAYANILGKPITLEEAQALGKKASTLSKERKLNTGKTRDPRFGYVKTYMEEVLNEIFDK